MSDRTLFDIPPADAAKGLRLRADPPHRNFMRERKGQPPQVTLRDDRTGRIVATVYGGEELAKHIINCVNEKGGLR